MVQNEGEAVVRVKPAYSGDSDPGGMKVDVPAGKGTCDGVATTAKHRPESIVAKPRDALSSERRACDRLGAIPEPFQNPRR